MFQARALLLAALHDYKTPLTFLCQVITGIAAVSQRARCWASTGIWHAWAVSEVEIPVLDRLTLSKSLPANQPAWRLIGEGRGRESGASSECLHKHLCSLKYLWPLLLAGLVVFFLWTTSVECCSLVSRSVYLVSLNGLEAWLCADNVFVLAHYFRYKLMLFTVFNPGLLSPSLLMTLKVILKLQT